MICDRLTKGLFVKRVSITRGKLVRAEPIAAVFEQGRAHIVGQLPLLEEELVSYVPGQTKLSPNRMDAMVWAARSWTGP
jgi:phage terminase large subunit-like protein